MRYLVDFKLFIIEFHKMVKSGMSQEEALEKLTEKIWKKDKLIKYRSDTEKSD